MSWPDVEGAMRDYLRADSGVSTIVGTRVFFGVPRNGAKFPLVTIQRVGGGQDLGEAPLDGAQIQLDCWANGHDKATAESLREAVRDALDALRGRTTQGSVRLLGADVISDLWAPDPASDQARYTVTASVAAMSA